LTCTLTLTLNLFLIVKSTVQYDPGRDWRGSEWFRSLGEDEDTISFWSLDPAFDLDNGPHISRFQAMIGQGSDHDWSRFTKF
jgi:hypothetical protein